MWLARTLHAVGREVLESGPPGRSAAFQAAATPSQLPTQTKKARCLCDTGLSVFFAGRYGQVSQAQWIGRGIRRLIGKCTRPSSQFVTEPYRSHGRLSLKLGSPTTDCLLVFYRIDAAEAEMVHEKILNSFIASLGDKIPATPELFPLLGEFLHTALTRFYAIVTAQVPAPGTHRCQPYPSGSSGNRAG